MKKVIGIVALVLLAFGLVACDSTNNADKGKDDGFKVGLILSGSTTDGGWSESAYNGILLAEKDLGAEIIYSENTQTTDFEKVFRDYAKDGCDVIVGHGYEFGDAGLKVAEEFPDVKFVITSTDISNGTNLGSILCNYEQMGFLQGVFAAAMTEGTVTGAIGGMQIPSIVTPIDYYKIGATYQKSNITVTNAFTGSFDDASKVKEQGLSIFDQGANIIMVNADHAGRGGYEAANDTGNYVIASIAAEYEEYPKSLIACGEADMSEAILQILTLVKDDKFEAKNYLLGVEDDIVRLTYNPALEDSIPKDVKDLIDSIVKDMKDGKLDVKNL